MSYRENRRNCGRYGGFVKARRVQARRSVHAKMIDQSLKAPQAENAYQWLSAPNRFDLPTVDTNKPKNKAKSMRLSEADFWKKPNSFDRLINKDDIEENNNSNKKVVEQILETLEENSIPYYYGGEDTGIQIKKKDMEKAEKLTNNLYNALKKTL